MRLETGGTSRRKDLRCAIYRQTGRKRQSRLNNVDGHKHDNQPVTAGNDTKVTGANQVWIERGTINQSRQVMINK